MGRSSRWPLLIGVLALVLLGLRGFSCVDRDSQADSDIERTGDALEPNPVSPGGELAPPQVKVGSEELDRAPVEGELDGAGLVSETDRRPLERGPVWLQVTSAEDLAPSAATVGHVTFELHRVGGLHGMPPLFVGTTNAQGELEVELEGDWVRELHVGSRPDLIGRVTEPGYQQHTVRPEIHRSGESSCRLVLLAMPGGTARGRVTSASGQGVDASVSLQRWTPQISNPRGTQSQLPQPSLQLIASATYLGSGYFELHLAESVSGMLLAQRGGLGNACLRDLQLDVKRPRQDLHITLQGPGSVRGRLTDSGGTPVAGHTLMAHLAELEGTEPARGWGPAGRAQPGVRCRVEGAGSLWHRVVTDENGWFLIEGLRMDRYEIRASKEAVSSKMTLLLTKQPVLANGIALELVLKSSAPAKSPSSSGK